METGTTKWSTDAVSARERFSFWREVVCQSVFNVATESGSDGFSARIRGAQLGAIRVAAFDSTAHEIVRTQQHVARAPDDSYLISLQLSGQSLIEQDGICTTLDPSEIAIIDGQKPFHITFPAPVSRVIAVIPRDLVDQRAPWLQHRSSSKLIASDSPYAELARQHLLHLTRGQGAANTAAASLLTDNLLNLFTLANIGDAPPTGATRVLSIEALLAFCRQNLQKAHLTPRFVATHFGISLRTLHLRFEMFGQSFNRWLLDARLDACAVALRRGSMKRQPISEIAFGCGFNDLSHFNRTFRARFGTTPRQWRMQSQLQ
jgi:AraC family transcriptional activator of tynA and feaB